MFVFLDHSSDDTGLSALLQRGWCVSTVLCEYVLHTGLRTRTPEIVCILLPDTCFVLS